MIIIKHYYIYLFYKIHQYSLLNLKEMTLRAIMMTPMMIFKLHWNWPKLKGIETRGGSERLLHDKQSLQDDPNALKKSMIKLRQKRT